MYKHISTIILNMCLVLYNILQYQKEKILNTTH